MICHIVFVYSSADGQLSCFYFLAIMNHAAMTLHVQVFVWAYISIPLQSNPISDGHATPAKQSEGVALFGVSLDF